MNAMDYRSPRKSGIPETGLLEKHLHPQQQIPRRPPFSVPGLAPAGIPGIHLSKGQIPLRLEGNKWMLPSTISDGSRPKRVGVDTKARGSASNIDKVYDLTIFLPSFRGESHPASKSTEADQDLLGVEGVGSKDEPFES